MYGLLGDSGTRVLDGDGVEESLPPYTGPSEFTVLPVGSKWISKRWG